MPFHSRWFVFFSLVPLCIGLLSLAGWWINHETLASVMPGYADMTFNTSLCFVLLALALIVTVLFPNNRQLTQHIRTGLCASVGIFSIMTLMQNIIGVNFGIDNLLFDSAWYYPDNPYPGRMSPQTLVAFILSSTALLLCYHSIKFPLLINSCITVVKFLGVFGIVISLLFPIKPVGLPYLSSMSLFTAMAFIFIGLAVRVFFQHSDQYTKSEQQPFFLGIYLMFRLTYPQKFSVIIIVFALPLAVSTWFSVSSSNKAMATLQQEVAGLKISKEVMSLFAMVQRHRGMMNAFMQNRSIFKEELSKQEVAINEQLQRIQTTTGSLARFPQEEWLAVHATWQTIQQQQRNNVDVHFYWQKHVELVGDIMRLMQQLGNHSTLLYDLEPAVNTLASIVLLNMPRLFEAEGILRGKVTGFLADHVLTDKERLAMAKMGGKMDVRYESTCESMYVLEQQSDILSDDLIHYLNGQFIPSMQRFNVVLDSMKAKDSYPTRAKFFFLAATKTLNHGLTMYDTTIDFLKHILDERINEQMKERYILASVVLLALLIIFYLFIAFYQSVMITIQALGAKARQMQEGDFSSTLMLDNADELSHVVDSFNLVAKELLHAVDQAKKATVAKGCFLAAMSHEIRTPLNGVLGLTELVLDSRLTKQQREQLQTVHESGQTLLTILNDILDFSKMEAGQLELTNSTFSPNDLVEHITKLYTKEAHQKGIELIELTIPTLSHGVVGDLNRLRQVLMNLLNNAIKFTEKGEVLLQVESIHETEQHISLRFSVFDTGIGISTESQHKLFENFSQLDASHTRKYGGTGLGLAISRKLIRLMGSDIFFRSNKGEGSCFWFDLDFDKSHKLADAAIHHAAYFNQWRVLIVDSNTTSQKILCDTISGWTMPNDVIENEQEALDVLLAGVKHHDAYHIVLIVHTMSIMDGMTLAQRIKKEPSLVNLKVIMYGSPNGLSNKQTKEAYGLDATLGKPVHQSELYHVILSVMGVRKDQPDHTVAGPFLQRTENILLVEDVLINQKVTLGMLKKAGFTQVTVANNGVEAVKYFNCDQYDFILMDLSMPEMDGYTATKKIRAIEINNAQSYPNRTPIIALTAHAFHEEKEESLAVGMDDLLTKPLTGGQLGEMLNRWLPVDGQSMSMLVDTERYKPEKAIFTGLDVTILRRLYHDMGGGIGAIVAIYVQELPPQIDAICKAMEDNDCKKLKNAAHRLKGTSRSIGALGLATLCEMIEHHIKNIDRMHAHVRSKDLRDEAECVLLALNEPWMEEIR